MLIDLTCDTKKYFINMTNVIVLSTPVSPVSDKLFVFLFCFDDKDNIIP